MSTDVRTEKVFIEAFTESLGQLRMIVDELHRRLTKLEEAREKGASLGISGLPGSWTVTPLPEWDSEPAARCEKCGTIGTEEWIESHQAICGIIEIEEAGLEDAD